MKKSSNLLLIALACGLILTGCPTEKEPQHAETVQPTPEASQSPQTPSTLSPSINGQEIPMAATVNGKEITPSEVERATDILLMQYKDRIPPEEMEKAKPMFQKQALENLINQNLLVQEADRQGIKADPETVDARFKQVSGRFPNEEAFQKAVESAGVSTQEIHEDIRQNLQVETLLEGKLSNMKEATKDEVNTFYKEHPEKFKTPDRIRASHILISTKSDDSPEEKARKFEKATKLKREIDNGADFAKLAQEYSDCPSKAKGGDLGYFGMGQMVKPFEDAALHLKVGEVSDVVETQFGYHIIKLVDRQEAGVASLEQVRDQIVSYLNNQRKQEAVGQYVDQLRESAKIEYGEETKP